MYQYLVMVWILSHHVRLLVDRVKGTKPEYKDISDDDNVFESSLSQPNFE